MAKPEQSKFKYMLSPENTYIIDYGDFVYEVKGSEIMAMLRREAWLDDFFKTDESELMLNTEKPVEDKINRLFY